MQRILARQVSQYVGKQIRVRGWINTTRAFGKLISLILRVRSGFVQIVVESEEEREKIVHLQPGSIVAVEGVVVNSREVSQGVEITEAKVVVENAIQTAPPIEYYRPQIRSDLDVILDHRPIA